MNNLEFAKSFEKIPAACMRFTKNEDGTYLAESTNCYLKLDEDLKINLVEVIKNHYGNN